MKTIIPKRMTLSFIKIEDYNQDVGWDYENNNVKKNSNISLLT